MRVHNVVDDVAYLLSPTRALVLGHGEFLHLARVVPKRPISAVVLQCVEPRLRVFEKVGLVEGEAVVGEVAAGVAGGARGFRDHVEQAAAVHLDLVEVQERVL